MSRRRAGDALRRGAGVNSVIEARPLSARVDQAGAVASSLCAIHCAASALLPAALGVLGAGALMGHMAEWIFTAVALSLAVWALWPGGIRSRSPGVIALFVLGIFGLLASRGLEARGGHLFGTVVGVLAGLSLLAGHILSLRARRCGPEGCP